MNPTHCPFCGSPLAANTKICEYCGSAIPPKPAPKTIQKSLNFAWEPLHTAYKEHCEILAQWEKNYKQALADLEFQCGNDEKKYNYCKYRFDPKPPITILKIALPVPKIKDTDSEKNKDIARIRYEKESATIRIWTNSRSEYARFKKMPIFSRFTQTTPNEHCVYSFNTKKLFAEYKTKKHSFNDRTMFAYQMAHPLQKDFKTITNILQEFFIHVLQIPPQTKIQINKSYYRKEEFDRKEEFNLENIKNDLQTFIQQYEQEEKAEMKRRIEQEKQRIEQEKQNQKIEQENQKENVGCIIILILYIIATIICLWFESTMTIGIVLLCLLVLGVAKLVESCL